ncbi:MAG: hypothetical protein R3F30_13860 [Planctomycetota bacterium]
MRTLSISLLSGALLVGSAAAQVGPGQFQGSTASTQLTVNSSLTGTVPMAAAVQISNFTLPGDGVGVFTTCITGTSLPTTYGGAGGYDLLIGTWDRNTGKYTPTSEAAALNTTGTEFGLMIDPTGRYCVYDSATSVMFSMRTKPGTAFGTPVAVSGPTATYVDPSLGYIGGKLFMFWVNGNDIVMSPLDITTPTAPKVSTTSPYPMVVVKSVGGRSMNSPTPVFGADNDVEGLWLAGLISTASDNDMFFDGDLDPTTDAQIVEDTSTWINNGGVADGMLTHVGVGWVYDIQAAWLVGDVESLNGTADITGAMYLDLAKKEVGVTALFLSGGYAASTIAVPGIQNVFGLDLKTFTFLGTMAHAATERTSVSFTIPNDASLKGKSFPIQGLSVNAKTSKFAFTNTSALTVN